MTSQPQLEDQIEDQIEMEPTEWSFKYYEVNPAALETVEDIAEFLYSLNMRVCLAGGTTFEQMGHNPRFWREVQDATPPAV